MEQLRKIWKQVDRRLVLTIIVVGAIALGFVFPLKPADLSEQVATATQSIASIDRRLATANQSIISTDQQVSLLIAEINGVSSRLAQLEAKPDRSPELEDALASIKGTTAKLQVLEFMLSNLTERVAELEVGGVGYDSTFKTEVLHRLDALEYALDVTPPSSSNTSITAPFNVTNCSWQLVFGAKAYGQQFVTTLWDFHVSSVRMYLKRVGSPTQAVITLYSAGTNGLPTGAPLWTKTVDPSSWSLSGQWQTLTVTGVVLPDHSKFVLAVASPTGDENNKIGLGWQTTGKYIGGGVVGTYGDGSPWTGPDPTVDFGFAIYGVRY